MDGCSFFIIDSSTPVGDGRDGTLFRIEQRTWGAEYAVPKDNDPDPRGEYDRPPISVGKQERSTDFVYCSKQRPTVFGFYDGKWQADHLHPGNDSEIGGADESAYMFYYAACHDAIVHDAAPKNHLARRLGYRFRDGDGGADEDSMAPRDMLK